MFVLNLIRWFVGYVVFAVEGNGQERFVNLCARFGYTIWNVRRKEYFFVSISRTKYRMLKNLAKQTGVKIRVYKKHGLPFVMYKFPNIKGMLAGLVVFIVLLSFLSTRVWSIQVEGNQELNSDLILLTAEEIGLKEGMARSKLDVLSIQNQLMIAYPEIAWISLNTKGSSVTIRIGEKEDKPDIWNSDKKVMNIKAARDGQVVRMEVTHGTPQVKVGDGVAEGQLLVSGITETKYNNLFTRATAKIIAETKHTYEIKVPLTQDEKIPTGNVIRRRALKLFGFTMPITFEVEPKDNNGLAYEKDLAIYRAKANDANLPATVYEETWTEYQVQQIQLTEEQALQKAKEELEKQQNEALKEDDKILSTNTTYTVENGQLILRAASVWEENIAQESEIYVE